MGRVIIIPARLASDRLPEKLLLSGTGQPLLQHTYERCHRVSRVDRVVVAADGDRIASATRAFGGEAVITDPDLPSGTDRVAAAVAQLGLDSGADVIVNVQGDEPEIDPASVAKVFELLEAPEPPGAGRPAMVATLVTPRRDAEGFANPNRVKVVADDHDYALYFSRSGIPFPRSEGVPWAAREAARESGPERPGRPSSAGRSPGAWLCHIGIYGFRPGALSQFVARGPTPLERLERLGQLRFLELGFGIRIAQVASAAEGIDTREDYDRFVERLRSQEGAS